MRSAAADRLVAWDPVTLRREPVRDGRIELPPLGSVVVVPGGPVDEPRGPVVEEIPLGGPWRLDLAGSETEMGAGPRPWTDLGPDEAGFAGVGRYATDVQLAVEQVEGRTVVLALDDVGDLARILVNGTDCGIVWTHPWEIEVTGAVHPGRNTVDVHVANAWMNRLIAEAGAPTGEIFEPVAGVYASDAPMHESGLRGPVVLRFRPSS